MKKILVVTGTRSEYGLLYWSMKEIQKDKELDLQLIVTGNHLSQQYGMTIKQIEDDGFNIDEKIDMLISSEQKSSILKSMGLEMIQMAQSLDRLKPDALLILGDRYETFIAATCAMMMNIPIAHMNGGESTEGVIDEQIRHSITKMAHIHFAGAQEYKEKIIKMGEEEWRVYNVGQAGVENIKRLNLLSKKELYRELGIDFHKKVFLVTYHPVTLNIENIEYEMEQLLMSLNAYEKQADIIFTYPNADFGSQKIINKINNYALNKKNVKIVHSLGQLKYLSLLKYANIVIGNSSSGIIETPIFKCPTVNIGDRQKGRIRNKNILDCKCEYKEIIKSIDIGLSKEFNSTLNNMENFYGDGTTSKQIVSVLKKLLSNKKILFKKLTFRE